MNTSLLIEVLFVVVTIVLVLVVAFRAQLTRAQGGKILAFIVLLIFPVLAVWAGFSEHMDRAESTRFCLSCHNPMSDYGKSLYVNDPSFVPARHFQNNLVPRDHACYTCHTDYTLFGPLHSKMRGLHHVYVEYFGTIPKPDKIKLYTPYNNRECLHCHLGARTFEEEPHHLKPPGTMAKIKSNQMSCMSSNCHDTIHDLDDLKDATFWKETQ